MTPTTTRHLLLSAALALAAGASALPLPARREPQHSLAARDSQNGEMAVIVIGSSVGVMLGGMLFMLLLWLLCSGIAALWGTAYAGADPKKKQQQQQQAKGYPPPARN